MIVLGIVIVLAIAAAVTYYIFRKRNLDKMFNDVFVTSKQVPKQKRNSYHLLMFQTSIAASKSKDTTPEAAYAKLNNPKYLELQLIKMSTYIKDRDKVKDKTIKRSLQLLDAYLIWEKNKLAKEGKAKDEKTSDDKNTNDKKNNDEKIVHAKPKSKSKKKK
jgi:hypothetical protein